MNRAANIAAGVVQCGWRLVFSPDRWSNCRLEHGHDGEHDASVARPGTWIGGPPLVDFYEEIAMVILVDAIGPWRLKVRREWLSSYFGVAELGVDQVVNPDERHATLTYTWGPSDNPWLVLEELRRFVADFEARMGGRS